MKINKTFTVLSFYYSFIFMAGSIVNSYINIYFADIELNYTEIGLLSSLGAFVSIISQPIWGTLSDKSENKNTILKIMLFGTVSTIWLIPLAGKNFIFIMMAVVSFNFFHKAMSPINDTIAIDLSKSEGFKFSTIRLIGSLGFAIMTAIGGKIVSINVMSIFYVCFIFMSLSFFISFFIPKVEGHKNSKVQKGFIDLLKDKKLMGIYFYTFILSSTNAFFQSFHAIYSKELGIELSVVGFGIMVGSLSQFPVMFVFGKLFKKFGLINLMTVAGLAYGIRWLFYGTILSSSNTIFIWLIHGLNYMLLYLCLVDYVQTNVPKELYTRGQVMNTLTLFGFSSVFGSFIGGHMAKLMGAQKVFLINGAVCLVVAIAFNVIQKKIERRKKVKTNI